MKRVARLSIVYAGLQVCCSPPSPAPQPAEQRPTASAEPATAARPVDIDNDHVRRAMYFLETSGCDFVEKMAKDPAEEAVWHKHYYCEAKRIYLRLFVFESQRAALAYAEAFMKKIGDRGEGTRGHSRLELIHRWGVNGPLLFIVRGDDEGAVNTVLSHFAGEE